MITNDWRYWGLLAIAGTTALTGLGQIVIPKATLRALSTENTPASRHFFGTIGMFMAVVGGALLHALATNSDSHILVFWTAVQKLGASVAVTLGVIRGIFSPLALLVASFDFLCGLFAISSWRRALHGQTRGRQASE